MGCPGLRFEVIRQPGDERNSREEIVRRIASAVRVSPSGRPPVPQNAVRQQRHIDAAQHGNCVGQHRRMCAGVVQIGDEYRCGARSAGEQIVANRGQLLRVAPHQEEDRTLLRQQAKRCLGDRRCRSEGKNPFRISRLLPVSQRAASVR